MRNKIYIVIVDEVIVKSFDSEIDAKAFVFDAMKSCIKSVLIEEVDHSASTPAPAIPSYPVSPGPYIPPTRDDYPTIPHRPWRVEPYEVWPDRWPKKLDIIC